MRSTGREGRRQAVLDAGIELPPKLKDIIDSAGDGLSQPLVVEGMAGEGKTTQLQRELDGASGLLYVTCKESDANTWQCIARGLNLTGVKDEVVVDIMLGAMEKYKRETGKTPLVVIDDIHYALDYDKKPTRVFLSYCSAAFDEGIFNVVLLGNGLVEAKAVEVDVPGLRARLERDNFVDRESKEIEFPLARELPLGHLFGEQGQRRVLDHSKRASKTRRRHSRPPRPALLGHAETAQSDDAGRGQAHRRRSDRGQDRHGGVKRRPWLNLPRARGERRRLLH